jgi:hypothetical protein
MKGLIGWLLSMLSEVSGGVVEWWSGGVVEWWSGGVVAKMWGAFILKRK